MKAFIFIVVVFTFFLSCVSTKEDKNENISNPIQNVPQNTMDSQIGDQGIMGIIGRLKSDLGKSVNILLSENPNAVSLRNQGYPNTIVSGRGGVFGSGQFYGYSWTLKNGLVENISYLQPFNEKDYQDAINNYFSILGNGIDLNGNGFGWLIPEKGGITIVLINGANNFIVHQSFMGYDDNLVKLRNK
jgi:hypothetical protein